MCGSNCKMVRRRVRRSFFFSSRRRHTRLQGDWSSDVCSSDLGKKRVGRDVWQLVEKDIDRALERVTIDLAGIEGQLVATGCVIPLYLRAHCGATDAERDRKRDRNCRVHGRGSAEKGLLDRKSTRLNSSHLVISYAVFCLKKKK